MTSEVLVYVNALIETLEIDYRLYKTKSHQQYPNAEYHNQALEQIRSGTYDFGIKFTVDEGNKYYKIIMMQSGNKSVHAFVNKNTGEVFKAASWKSPAKNVRYNLLDPTSRKDIYRKADWASSYLYAR